MTSGQLVLGWLAALGPIVSAFAVIIALSQFGLSKRSAERQDRAYVFVDSGMMILTLGKVPEAVIDIKNTGKTPAFNIRHVGYCRFTTYPAKFDKFVVPSDVFATNSILAPATSTTGIWKSDQMLSQELFDELKAGKSAFFIHGEVTYLDAFGKQRRYEYKRMVGGAAGVQGDMISNSDEGDFAN